MTGKKVRGQNQLFLQAKRDIYNNIWMNKYKYIMACFIFVLFCLYFEAEYRSAADLGWIENNAGFGDIILFIFRGMKVYVPDPSIEFKIPITWLTVQAFIIYLTGNYITLDMTTYGQQYIIRTPHKGYWLLGKLIYCIACVVSFYMTGYLVVGLYSLAAGHASLEIHADICAYVSDIPIELLDRTDLLLGAVVLPVVTSIVLSFFQMILSLVIKPVYSVICMMIYVCASAYYLSYFLIGNYSMILRSHKIVSQYIVLQRNGIDPYTALCVNGALLAVGFIIALMILKKYDYIDKR